MKFIKIIYNDESKDILDLIPKVEQFAAEKHINIKFEVLNIDDYKQKKKAIPIMTRHGTKNVPLVVFENENLDEYAAIWSETNPDWKLEIQNKLKYE